MSESGMKLAGCFLRTRGCSSRKTGFTLLELLMVMVITGILGGVLILNFSGGQNRAKAVTIVQNLNTLKKAATLYYYETGQWTGDGWAWIAPYVDSHAFVSDPNVPDSSRKYSINQTENGTVIVECRISDTWGGSSELRMALATLRQDFSLLNGEGEPYAADDPIVAMAISQAVNEGDPGSTEEDSGSYDNWDADTVYLGGDRVSVDGADFEARYWTQGDEPGNLSSPWQELTDEWRDFNIYEAGDVVVYNGATFEARNWTQNSQPGLIGSPWQEVTDEWRNFNIYSGGDIAVYDGQTWRAKWYTQNNEPGSGPEWELVD